MKIKEALSKLILDELPKHDKNIQRKEKYVEIRKALTSKEVDVEIQILLRVKLLCDEFMTKF